jgi:pimeloyl-ACP methyl ester carboxylesterase
MAMRLPASPPTQDDERWYDLHRARTNPNPPEPHDRPRASKKRSANAVKSRPANPAVISSILDSFDSLTPPAVASPNDAFSDTSSRRSRPSSADGTVASVPSSSAGFGVEYGTGPALSDETSPTDAAPPPSIRTSRPPSGLSHFTGPRSAQIDSNGRLRPASLISSRSSSFSSLSKEKESGVKNKHSAESWVKPRPSRQASPVGSALTKTSSRTSSNSHRSLRRVTSQETLRPPTIDEFDGPVIGADPRALSRAEQIIARTPPPSLSISKGRLYLTDAVSEEQVITDSPVSSTKMSDPSSSCPPSSQKTESTARTTPNPTPQRISPKKSPIVDSIPTRTSSLRQASISPAGRKREKKSKRLPTATSKADSLSPPPSNAIPESSWADLGEDDDTVKRIRELREQRKSRLQESKHFSLPADLPQSSKASSLEIPARELTPRRSDEGKRASRVRPSANRTSTEPPIKAAKVLGLKDDAPVPGASGAFTKRPASNSPERTRRPLSRLEENWALYAESRPTTASPPTPPLSLDYSYAQVVDALSGVERELLTRDKLHERKLSKSSVLSARVADLPPLSKPSLESASSARLRPKSAGRKEVRNNRWTAIHPDLPLDLQKKNRRKSMSDARRTRNHVEDEPEPQQRDSIEDAVLEYLRAPRLSRTVRHPATGRLISFSEVGDPEGAAVFICVGMGLTRFVTAFYDELAATLRLRLITVDRPGVGGSEPYPPHDRTGPLGWPEDVLAICQELGITKFSLLAHSAGAIYALATALICPHMVKGKVHLLAPWIPPSQLEAVPAMASAPPAGALPRSQRFLRVLPTSFLKAANSSFMTATSASLKPANKRQLSAGRERSREQPLSPTHAPERLSSTQRPDNHRRESMMLMDQFMPTVNPMENFPIPVQEEEDAVNVSLRRGSLAMSATASPLDPSLTFANAALNAAEHTEKERRVEEKEKERQLEYTSRLTQLTWELATRDSNPATDLLVCLERHREIGFRYTDVVREVVITHGSEDKRVPVGNVKWLGDQINNRAYAGLTRENSSDTVPQSRDGWADQRYSRGGCEVRILEGEGHGLMASAPIMSDVLTEIAGYWTDHRGSLA